MAANSPPGTEYSMHASQPPAFSTRGGEWRRRAWSDAQHPADCLGEAYQCPTITDTPLNTNVGRYMLESPLPKFSMSHPLFALRERDSISAKPCCKPLVHLSAFELQRRATSTSEAMDVNFVSLGITALAASLALVVFAHVASRLFATRPGSTLPNLRDPIPYVFNTIQFVFNNEKFMKRATQVKRSSFVSR